MARPTLSRVAAIFRSDDGYVTPKMIVRAAVFSLPEGTPHILMVKETADGRWTLPGGWIDLGESAAYAAEREVLEETGVRVTAEKLAAVFDKRRHDHPPAPHHAYLIFFLCRLEGGSLTPSIETSEVGWFPARPAPGTVDGSGHGAADPEDVRALRKSGPADGLRLSELPGR